MAHIVEDRILESTTTTGTGALTLDGAITGFRSFSAVCAVGDTVPYFIEAIDSLGQPTGDYEYGVATYSAADELTRTKVDGSSNAGAVVNFAAGSKNVGIPAMASSLVPTGAIFDFPANTAPAGFSELDGGLLSRVQYPALWAYAQSSGNIAASDGAWTKGQWSPGDGSTTFRKPDHRGYHRRSWDNGAGVNTGRTIGSIEDDQMPQHSHGVTDPGHAHTWGTNTVVAATAGAGGPAFGSGSSATSSSTTGITINNAGTGTETRVKTIAVLTCVKT